MPLQAGIESTYRLGTLFRQMYGGFLGDTYYQTEVNATSTDIPRTKLSLQAFMAGLFPSKGVQQWNAASGALGTLWQPFVYHYMPKHLDDVSGLTQKLRPSCVMCDLTPRARSVAVPVHERRRVPALRQGVRRDDPR